MVKLFQQKLKTNLVKAKKMMLNCLCVFHPLSRIGHDFVSVRIYLNLYILKILRWQYGKLKAGTVAVSNFSLKQTNNELTIL